MSWEGGGGALYMSMCVCTCVQGIDRCTGLSGARSQGRSGEASCQLTWVKPPPLSAHSLPSSEQGQADGTGANNSDLASPPSPGHVVTEEAAGPCSGHCGALSHRLCPRPPPHSGSSPFIRAPDFLCPPCPPPSFSLIHYGVPAACVSSNVMAPRMRQRTRCAWSLPSWACGLLGHRDTRQRN